MTLNIRDASEYHVGWRENLRKKLKPWLSFSLGCLSKEADPEGAEDKQVYDLCPYVIALYGLISSTNGSPRILDALLRISTLASLPSLW